MSTWVAIRTIRPSPRAQQPLQGATDRRERDRRPGIPLYVSCSRLPSGHNMGMGVVGRRPTGPRGRKKARAATPLFIPTGARTVTWPPGRITRTGHAGSAPRADPYEDHHEYLPDLRRY